MTVKGVLFDFSGTLFRIESAGVLAACRAGRSGTAVPDEDVLRYARELEEAGALPGGAPPRAVPPHLEEVWAVPGPQRRAAPGRLHRYGPRGGAAPPGVCTTRSTTAI